MSCTWCSAIREPAGPWPPAGRRLAGVRAHRRHRLVIEPAVLGVGRERGGGRLGILRGPVGAWLRHRLERVGGRMQPGRHRDGRCGRLAVIPGAVESLVVHAREARERLERRAPVQDALAVVGAQAHALHSADVSGPGFSHTHGDLRSTASPNA